MVMIIGDLPSLHSVIVTRGIAQSTTELGMVNSER